MNVYSEKLRNFDGSLDQFLKEEGLTFKELVKICGLGNITSPNSRKYLSFINGRYQIVKKMNGRKKICGSFKTLQVAKKYRNYLVEHGWSEEAINHVRKISEASIRRNNSGYYRVSKCKSANTKQGFYYSYQYPDENGKQKAISSVDLKKLEAKVKARGLEWRRVNEF